jgi:hypothetical protein
MIDRIGTSAVKSVSKQHQYAVGDSAGDPQLAGSPAPPARRSGRIPLLDGAAEPPEKDAEKKRKKFLDTFS